jgi:hypothetical protein
MCSTFRDPWSGQPAELQGRNAFDRIHEDADGGEVIADRQFAAGENGSVGHAELVIASLAFPDATGGVCIYGCAFAARAERGPAVVGEPDGDEAIVRLVIGHLHDGFEAQRPGFSGKEKVLGHVKAQRGRSWHPRVTPLSLKWRALLDSNQ